MTVFCKENNYSPLLGGSTYHHCEGMDYHESGKFLWILKLKGHYDITFIKYSDVFTLFYLGLHCFQCDIFYVFYYGDIFIIWTSFCDSFIRYFIHSSNVHALNWLVLFIHSIMIMIIRLYRFSLDIINKCFSDSC